MLSRGCGILHLLLHRGEQVAEIAFHLGPVDVLKPRLHTHGPDGIPAEAEQVLLRADGVNGQFKHVAPHAEHDLLVIHRSGIEDGLLMLKHGDLAVEIAVEVASHSALRMTFPLDVRGISPCRAAMKRSTENPASVETCSFMRCRSCASSASAPFFAGM